MMFENEENNATRLSKYRTPLPVTQGVILVRHAEVDRSFRSVCYGQTDVPLSLEGKADSAELARYLTQYPIEKIVHSDLSRTQILANQLGEKLARKKTSQPVTLIAEPALRERNFGSWEGQQWDSIYEQVGDEMLKMVSQPDSYRTGGGETTNELANRAWDWFRENDFEKLTIVCTHGGVIASLLGRLFEKPVSEWWDLIPPYAKMVYVPTLSSQNACSLLTADERMERHEY